MKHIHLFSFLLLLSVCIGLTACSEEEESKPTSGLTERSWTKGQTLEMGQKKELSVTFRAAGRWEAKVTTGSEWCKVNPPSGEKGRNSLRISVEGESETSRTARITIEVEGYALESLEVRQKEQGEDAEINREVDKFLRGYYLWNDEYKTLEPDFSKRYDNFFYDALNSLTTNTLDKKLYTDGNGNSSYRLFSYIQLLPDFGSTRTTHLVQKERSYSFGITGITLVSAGEFFFFCLQGVHPDSPAAKAGLKRGAWISRVDGKEITGSNYVELYYNLLVPDRTLSYTLTESVIKEGNIEREEEFEVSSEAIYVNPILFSEVKEEFKGHRIGYLVYSGFDGGFDEELFSVFREFKSKNITDLVLDLRYNGGGHVMSANLIATCIAGSASQGKVFNRTRYNDERMKRDFNNQMPEELFAYNHYPNLKMPLTDGALNLKRVYCLVGGPTASASELVINALKGIDVEVILIGERTTGKNVGMEVIDIKSNGKTYRVAPITFQSYNAKGDGDYEHGFVPDITLKENIVDSEDFFLGIGDFGAPNEPLLARAIQEITGSQPAQTRSIGLRGTGQVLPMPAPYRPGRDGMLKPVEPIE